MMAVALAGMLTGLGVALLLAALRPAPPSIMSVVDRLDPGRALEQSEPASVVDRAGVWVLRQEWLSRWARTPQADLVVTGLSAEHCAGRRVVAGLTGLLAPAVFGTVLLGAGISSPITVPIIAAPLLAVGMVLVVDRDLARRAKGAREEFRRALTVYVDLVILERRVGSGTRQALVRSAAVGEHWAFRMIAGRLDRSQWEGSAPWVGLTDLAQETAVPELGDLAETIRMAGEQGADIDNALSARSDSLREELLTAQAAGAQSAAEAMAVPASLLAVVFLVLIGLPAVLTITAQT